MGDDDSWVHVVDESGHVVLALTSDGIDLFFNLFGGHSKGWLIWLVDRRSNRSRNSPLAVAGVGTVGLVVSVAELVHLVLVGLLFGELLSEGEALCARSFDAQHLIFLSSGGTL